MKGLLMALVPMLVCATAWTVTPETAAMARHVQKQLDALDGAVAATAREMGGVLVKDTADPAAVRPVLRKLLAAQPLVEDAGYVTAAGRLAIIEPAKYRKSEGTDISKQPQVQRLLATKKPVMGGEFRMVEGFDAVDVEHPAFGRSRELLGAASATFKPGSLLGPILGKPDPARPLYVVQAVDGRMLWPAMKGPRPWELETAMKHILPRARGRAFVGKDEVRWTTVGLHGMEWRIVEILKNG